MNTTAEWFLEPVCRSPQRFSDHNERAAKEKTHSARRRRENACSVGFSPIIVINAPQITLKPRRLSTCSAAGGSTARPNEKDVIAFRVKWKSKLRSSSALVCVEQCKEKDGASWVSALFLSSDQGIIVCLCCEGHQASCSKSRVTSFILYCMNSYNAGIA